MRSAPLNSFEPTDRDEEDSFKDIYWPDFDDLPGETSVAFRVRFAFTGAGYNIRKIEEVDAPPVVIVRAIRTDAPRISDARLFFQHIRELLRAAGFRLRKDELTVEQTGNRILAAFPSGKPTPDIEEILHEPQDGFADYADVVL